MSTSSSPPSAIHPRQRSRQDKIERLRQAAIAGWKPPPRISVVEWADTFRHLAPEAGSTSGKWQTSMVEAARGPMLAATEPGVHIITTMVCTQLLKTSLLENIFGYFAHLDPCPMLLLQPKEAAAEQFSKERISPMIRVTPALKGLIGTSKTRSADETILSKTFPGGFLALAGAGSPDNLARRPIRVLLCDEVDKYPITREGDPIALAEERTATFHMNWLSVRACSPTIEDASRIAASYADSDQRRASVVCPHCKHRQFLDFFKHVHWDKDGDKHLVKTARVFCEACGAGWSEGDRQIALDTMRWHQTRPYECCGSRRVPLDDYDTAWRAGDAGAVDTVWEWWESPRHAVYRCVCPTCRKWPVDNMHAGFQASKLYSPWQKDKPSDIAAKYLASKDSEDLKQAWWNTQMALPYRPHVGRELRIDALLSRCEHWAGDVPEGVAVVTVGVDVQDYRVELETVGWGRNEESWSIDHTVLEGDLESPAFWNEVDAYLRRIWYRQDGRGFEVKAACIDSGGHHTQRVYDFSKARLGRRIWAIKGESARTGTRSPVWPVKSPSARNKKSFRPIIIGVNAAKDVIRGYLLKEPSEAGYPPGYMHFPSDRDVNYFAQMTAERLVVREKSGQKFFVWELPAGKANEALDLRVYAYAALCGLIHKGFKLNRSADHFDAAAPEALPASKRPLPRNTDISLAQALPVPADPADPKPSPPTGQPTEAEARRARLRNLVRRMSR